MLVLESSSVERTVERIAWKSPGFECSGGTSCGIGEGSGLKAREHASCKRQVEPARHPPCTAGISGYLEVDA
jgi:hypothetical protein